MKHFAILMSLAALAAGMAQAVDDGDDITFVSDGKTVETRWLYPDLQLGTLPNVSKPGYALVGWFDTDVHQVTETTLFQDLRSYTITAHWLELLPAVVSNVVARQRWPWNGLVDIDYEVGGYTAGLEALIEVADAEGGRSWQVTNFLAGAEPSVEVGFHRATWDTTAAGLADVVASNAVATVSLLRFPPNVEQLTVAGVPGIPVPGRENRFVSNLDPSGVSSPSVAFPLAGQEKALPVKAEAEYVNSEGQRAARTEEFQVGLTSGSIALVDGIAENTTVRVTFSYKDLPQSEAIYSFVFDSVAPSLSVATQLTSDYNLYEGRVYTNDPTPEFMICANGVTDWDQGAREIDDPDNGIWIGVAENQTDYYHKKLLSADLDKCQNSELFVTLPRLSNGSHTLVFRTLDLAGNQTPGSQETLTIDTVKPVVIAEGHNGNYDTNSMYVDNSTTTLDITVNDENLMFQDPAACVTMTSNRGDSSEPTETGTDNALIQYAYSLDHSYGKNVWTFTVVDAAGNQSVKEYEYDYNKPPQITEDAENDFLNKNFSLTPASPEVENGQLTLGRVVNLFKEVDGSSIVADKDHVSVDNLGEAVASWNINDEGEIVLTLASFTEGGTATLSSPNITVQYTDEYQKSASFSFSLQWKNK